MPLSEPSGPNAGSVSKYSSLRKKMAATTPSAMRGSFRSRMRSSRLFVISTRTMSALCPRAMA